MTQNILPQMNKTAHLESIIETYGIKAINYNGFDWSYDSTYIMPNGTEQTLDQIVIAHLFKS